MKSIRCYQHKDGSLIIQRPGCWMILQLVPRKGLVWRGTRVLLSDAKKVLEK